MMTLRRRPHLCYVPFLSCLHSIPIGTINMTLLLTDLPIELLRTILIYAGDYAKTLLSCEHVCHVFRRIVLEDETWQLVKPRNDKWNGFHGVTSERFRGMIFHALTAIRKEKIASEQNVIVQLLGVDGWRALLLQSVELLAGFEDVDVRNHSFIMRNDTCGILAELVQDAMCRLFQRACDFSCTIAQHTHQYPVVTADIFQHELVDFLDYRAVSRLSSAQGFRMNYDEIMQEADRDNLIRRLSHRANVVKMTNEVFGLAWETLIRTILLLLLPVCHECIDQNVRGTGKRPLCREKESVRDITPFSKPIMCPECNVAHQYIHTPVPRQIENAARGIGLCTKVYGSLWMSRSYPERVAMEEEAVMEDYEYMDESSDDESFEWVDEHVNDDLVIKGQIIDEDEDSVEEMEYEEMEGWV